jgi:hypothetical protein
LSLIDAASPRAVANLERLSVTEMESWKGGAGFTPRLD